MKAKGIGLLIVMVFLIGFVAAAQNIADAESSMHIKFSTWHPPASREVKTVWLPMLERTQETE